LVRERIRIFVPRSLVRAYTLKVKKNPTKYEEIEKAIASSRLPLTVQELLAISQFYAYISLVIGAIVGVVLFLYIPSSFVLYVFQYTPFYGQILRNYWLISKIFPLFGAIFGYVAYKMTRYVILSYPFYVANRRKGEIEMYLPHAINMMYGMAVGGLPIYDMLKAVAESRQLFGELSREFIVIIEMIDIFKMDVYQAMRYVRDTTPSPKLSGFLDNLIFVLQGGGKVSEFLKRKSEEYIEEQEYTFQSFVEFTGMLAEIYLAVFILLPSFLLIVLIVMQLLGQNAIMMYRFVIPAVLPIATYMIIWLFKSSLPLPKMKIEEYEERYTLIKANVVDTVRDSFTINRFKRNVNKIKRFILYPFGESLYTMQFRIISVHLAFLSILTLVILYSLRIGIVQAGIVSVSVFLIPLIVLIEVKERILRKTEEKLPDMFAELAMLNEAGLNLFEALKVLSMTEMGVLTKEISIMKKEIEWGVLVQRAFVRMGIRLKSDIMAKVVPVIVRALETSPTIKDAFTIVAKFADSEVKFKRRLRSSMFLYVVIIYISVGVFMFIAYMVIKNFLAPFANLTVTGAGGISFALDLDLIKEVFFELSLVVGISSGLVAGVIGEGKAILGIKHAYVFALVSYILFFYII
jgi:flagellar protein FlaJ